jgi:hypothetical protein
MPDTLIAPTGSLSTWDIVTNPGDESLGRLVMDGNDFVVQPRAGMALSGIEVERFRTKDGAMKAIAEHLKGKCSKESR